MLTRFIQAKYFSGASFAFFVVFLVAGSVALGYGRTFIINQAHKELPVTSPTSKFFKQFNDTQHNGNTLQRRVYWFNVTNPEDVVNNGATPNVVEVGPYVYTELKYKAGHGMDSAISWFSNTTIAYRYKTVFHFVPEASMDRITGRMLREDDVLTVLNVPLWAAAYRLSFIPAGRNKDVGCTAVAANRAVGKEGVFIQHTLEHLIWGFQPTLWKYLRELEVLAGAKVDQPLMFRTQWNNTITAPTPFNRSTGQRCPMNDHYETACPNIANQDTMQFSGAVWRGLGSLDNIGQLTQWAGQSELWWWGKGHCRAIKGSDGAQFPPGFTDSTPLHVFNDDILRPVRMVVRGDTNVKGIPTKELGIHPDDLAVNNFTSCFHQHVKGVFNMSIPLVGGQVATKAHFLDVEPGMVNVTLNNAKFSANRGDHDVTLHVEPILGKTIEGHSRIQINYFLGPQHAAGCPHPVPFTEKLPKTLFPIFWTDKYAMISDKNAHHLRQDLIVPLEAVKVCGILAIVLCVLCFFSGVYFWRLHANKLRNGDYAEKDGLLATNEWVNAS